MNEVFRLHQRNELGPSHPLLMTLDSIRKAGVIVDEIVLKPLSFKDVNHFMADALHCERARTKSLAGLVHKKTAGNPFFVNQFLTALAEEHVVEFDAREGTWGWDLARIRAKGYTDNVVDLMAGKLRRLPHATQEALGQLACLGPVAESATLALVQGQSEGQIHESLWEAVRVGLLLRVGSAYTFVHDRVQEAAYALIPESERAAVHLRIGRLFVSRTAPEEMEEKIFEIVNQLNRGTALIDSQHERERVAELNLVAGRRIVTNANASLRWLVGDSPNLAEAREATRRIIRDGSRAGEVVSRMRALFKKTRTTKERLDINEAIEEVVILTQGEVRRNKVALRMDLAANLPPVMGDRVQFQQVVVNLILNAIEAMSRW